MRKQGADNKKDCIDQQDDDQQTLPPETPTQSGDDCCDIHVEHRPTGVQGVGVECCRQQQQASENVLARESLPHNYHPKQHGVDATDNQITPAAILEKEMGQSYDGANSDDEALFAEILEAMVLEETPLQQSHQDELDDHAFGLDCMYEGVDYSEDDDDIIIKSSSSRSSDDVDNLRPTKDLNAHNCDFLRSPAALMPLADVEEGAEGEEIDA